jgi:hypothetical protein
VPSKTPTRLNGTELRGCINALLQCALRLIWTVTCHGIWWQGRRSLSRSPVDLVKVSSAATSPSSRSNLGMKPPASCHRSLQKLDLS